ncbi:MAG: TIGR02300 family protein, partial [Pseudomonadota bacterium]|nr:TIGR02300 family protein [Pseudomonadota bacterium]
MRVALGVKRQCPSCGARFYDLRKRPVVCPRCKAEVDLARAKPKPDAPAQA